MTLARPLFPETSDILTDGPVAQQMAHAMCPKYVYKLRTVVRQLPDEKSAKIGRSLLGGRDSQGTTADDREGLSPLS
jgi:hypothetical protein